MPRFLLTGGRSRSLGLRTSMEWEIYEEAVVVELDTERDRVSRWWSWTSPPENCPVETSSILFKAGSWRGGELVLCTQTEVLRVDPQSRRILQLLSLPVFNDVHHVMPSSAGLIVVSTGLDAVFEVTLDGAIARSWSGLETPIWGDRFHRHVDYRKVLTTKPHLAHPNYAFELDGSLWCTRFKQRDVICLETRRTSEVIAADPIHDGYLADDGHLWFTSVSGKLVSMDPSTMRVVERIDLADMEDTTKQMGWCRAVHVERGVAYVGFSRLRRTLVRENLAWMRDKLTGQNKQPAYPARISAYDLARRRKVAEWNLEDAGMTAVFSLLPVP